jgi:hypothetical protein
MERMLKDQEYLYQSPPPPPSPSWELIRLSGTSDRWGCIRVYNIYRNESRVYYIQYKVYKVRKNLRNLSLICVEYLFAPQSRIHTTKKLWVRAAYSRFCRLITTRNRALPPPPGHRHPQFQHKKWHPVQI